ncbi:hypothetical protein ACFM35_15965 [Microbacterium sp. P01]|uniref:hypothetical protein n=1 Tax=Microbacterium sp. P01 TaxID=3366261 RepID=UPI00366EC6CC
MESFEEGKSRSAAERLGDSIVQLVGSDGMVVLESPVEEFDRILRVSPIRPGAVAFDVMVGHDEDFASSDAGGLVVVHVHTPPLGWWTFDDESHGDGHAAAWSVINQLVGDGGEAHRGRHSSNLTNAWGVLVSGPHHNGGVRPKQRRTVFAPYRDSAPLEGPQDEAGTWFRGVTARTEMERNFVEQLRMFAGDWINLGLTPEKSVGVPAARPLLGVEVCHHADDLRWAWILVVEGDRKVRIECSWGDDHRLNDWGPSQGDVDFTVPRATATPHELAKYAHTWVREQASRQR